MFRKFKNIKINIFILNKLKTSPKNIYKLDQMLTLAYNVFFDTDLDSINNQQLSTSQRNAINKAIKTCNNILVNAKKWMFKNNTIDAYGRVLYMNIIDIFGDNTNVELKNKYISKQKTLNTIDLFPKELISQKRKWFVDNYGIEPEKLLAASIFYMFINSDTKDQIIYAIDEIYNIIKKTNTAKKGGKKRHSEEQKDIFENHFECFYTDWKNGVYEKLNYWEKVYKIQKDHRIGRPTAIKFIQLAKQRATMLYKPQN